jgi:hypothetical protein
MKAGFLLFTALFLAMMCLGNARTAMAQSVTGGGTINLGFTPPSDHRGVSQKWTGGHPSL